MKKISKLGKFCCNNHNQEMRSICYETGCMDRILCKICIQAHGHFDKLLFYEDLQFDNIFNHIDTMVQSKKLNVDKEELIKHILQHIDKVFNEIQEKLCKLVHEAKEILIQNILYTNNKEKQFIQEYEQQKSHIQQLCQQFMKNIDVDYLEIFAQKYKNFQDVYLNDINLTRSKMNSVIVSLERCEKYLEKYIETSLKNGYLLIDQFNHDSVLNQLKLTHVIPVCNANISHGGLAYNDIDNEVIIASKNGKLHIHSLESLQSISTTNVSNLPLNQILYLDKSKELIIGGDDGIIRICSIQKGGNLKLLDELSHQKDGNNNESSTGSSPLAPIYALAYSKINECLYSGGNEPYLHIWNITPNEKSHYKLDVNTGIGSLKLLEGDKLLCIGMQNGTIQFYQLNSLETEDDLKDKKAQGFKLIIQKPQQCGNIPNAHDKNWIFGLDYNPNDKLIATGSNDGYIKVWKLNGFDESNGKEMNITLDLIAKYHLENKYIRSVMLLKNQKSVLFTGDDDKLRVLNYNNNTIVRELKALKSAGNAFFYVHSKLLLVGAFENNLYIWESDKF